MPARRRMLGLVLLGVAAAPLSAAEPGERKGVSFRRDIKPLLDRQCLECHGPGQGKGGLRFTDQKSITAELDSGKRAVVPGKPGESELIRRITATDPEERMPKDRPALSQEQIENLRRWIEDGGEWQRHWSLVKPTRPEPPEVENESRVRNPIDRFVLARLEREGIEPSPPADRHTLLRRLSLDLTGLPPTPEQVDRFVGDDSADAYEKAVDRLLSSPRFGERWARHWMDLARYADSDGYEQDRWRPWAWRWRDWLIRSINRDQPFDEFTRDQIAGDLLPDATVEQKVATGFHRHSLLNREGGVDLEEDRVKYTVDRLNTVAKTWLGLTVECAECHDHKYDPVTQKEFYELYAFFNSLDNRLIKAPQPDRLEEVRSARQRFEAARKQYIEANAENRAFRSWVREVAAMEDIWTQPESYALPTFNATKGSNLFLQEDGSFLVTGWVRDGKMLDNYTASINTPMERITAFRIEAMTDPMLPEHGPGWGPRGNFRLSEVEVDSSPLSDKTALKPVDVERVVADYDEPGHGIDKALDGDRETGWSVTMPDAAIDAVDRAAVFVLDRDAGHDGGTRLKVLMRQKGGEGKAKLGRFRITMTSADPETAARQTVPGPVRRIAEKARDRRTEAERAKLLRYYHATHDREDASFVAFTKAFKRFHDARGDIQAMTVREREEKRVTRVHDRGDFLNPVGLPLTPDVPDSLHEMTPSHDPPNRLDLARWLVDGDNPLTARVTVNRFWMRLFGEGLVRSPANFGTQGRRPTHPTLLDWLATEFVRLGWSRKKMLKTILMSATYRQASRHRPELAKRDALNKLLARQNRFRLSAEAARDQFLAVGGLLEDQIGGRSVEAGSHRRGLYLKLKRKFLNPTLTTFDMPSTVTACTRRERSNTPLQALTLMNGPLFMDAARGLADRVIEHTPGADQRGNEGQGGEAADVAGAAGRIRLAYKLALGRSPGDAEGEELLALYRDLRTMYEADGEAAKQLLGGEAPADGVSRAEAAAMVMVARTILNLDQLIMRQ